VTHSSDSRAFDAHLEPEHLRDAVDALDAAIRAVDTSVGQTNFDDPQPDADTRASANLSAVSRSVGR
jgi:hypothetical protein